jgi:hypothetical protein
MPKIQETAPEFIRKGKSVGSTPDVRQTLNGNGNHPPALAADPMVEQASQGLEAINVLVNERNRMREDLEFQRHRISDLEAKLANAEYYHEYFRDKAEHFERFSFGLVSKMGTCTMVMNECQKQALEMGYNKPSPTPVPDAVPPQPTAEETLQDLEDTRLKDLASQLERP